MKNERRENSKNPPHKSSTPCGWWLAVAPSWRPLFILFINLFFFFTHSHTHTHTHTHMSVLRWLWDLGAVMPIGLSEDPMDASGHSLFRPMRCFSRCCYAPSTSSARNRITIKSPFHCSVLSYFNILIFIPLVPEPAPTPSVHCRFNSSR